MINIYIILIILFLHWFADFVLQTEFQAIWKSSQWDALLNHVGIYTSVWIFPVLIYGSVTQAKDVRILLFLPITFIAHLLIDYYTSRANKLLATEARRTDKWHDFFVGVGFDQFLHYVQLFLTFQLLK